jgi:hypothetical protein
VISLGEVTLLLRGFAEKRSPLRVVVRSLELNFSAACTVYKAEGGRVAFWIGPESDKSAIDFLIAGCIFDFRDVPADEAALLVGENAESGIAALREGTDFELLIMLLKCDDSPEEK